MSTPMGPGKLLDALILEGCKVVELPGWKYRNRNHKGPWGPVHGVMIHHTVTKGTNKTVGIIRDGYSSLPGPLSHGMIAKDGTVYLVGLGRANHAGLGDPDVLQAVISEKNPPRDNDATADGNRYFYGFECENLGDGKDPWPQAQIDAIEKASAAICRVHGWGAKSVIRHLDWQPGKIDPYGPGMDWPSLQGDIAKRLGQGRPPALPSPQRPVVSLSKLIAAARRDPRKAGTPVTYSGVSTVEAALVDEGLLSKKYDDGHYGYATIEAYAQWQRMCGFKGSDADGIPGKESLAKLAKKHSFQVIV